MSLTKEMIMAVEREVRTMGNSDLVIYHCTYKNQNVNYPNSFDRFRAETSLNEIYERGLEEQINEFSKNWGTVV